MSKKDGKNVEEHDHLMNHYCCIVFKHDILTFRTAENTGRKFWDVLFYLNVMKIPWHFPVSSK